MADRVEIECALGTVVVVTTAVADGDFRVAPESEAEQAALKTRRAKIAPQPWTWLRQVHGAEVVEVSAAGEWAGAEADGAVTSEMNCPISVATADCAPVVLVATSGLAIVHAGWRGLVAGIVEDAGRALRDRGGVPLWSMAGPCISPAAYEFGLDDLALVEARYGSGVRGTTSSGSTALDMPAAVTAAVEASGWPKPELGRCTSAEDFYSHRTRGDKGRQVTVGWIEPTAQRR